MVFARSYSRRDKLQEQYSKNQESRRAFLGIWFLILGISLLHHSLFLQNSETVHRFAEVGMDFRKAPGLRPRINKVHFAVAVVLDDTNDVGSRLAHLTPVRNDLLRLCSVDGG